jgi:hypothetical protein
MMPSLEGLACAVTVTALVRSPGFDRSQGIVIGIDSESFIFAALRGRSNSIILHRCLSSIFDQCSLVRFRHIDSDANPADFPSRFIPSSSQALTMPPTCGLTTPALTALWIGGYTQSLVSSW